MCSLNSLLLWVLRSGEITIPSDSVLDETRHLAHGDIMVHQDAGQVEKQSLPPLHKDTKRAAGSGIKQLVQGMERASGSNPTN